MIGEMLDRVIGAVSPVRGLRRMQVRKTLGEVRRSYEAAKSTRVDKKWKPSNQTADMELLGDADTMRARARDLVRNNSYAKGVLRAVLRNVVGHGIKPQAAVEQRNGKPNERFNIAAETLWERWCRTCDIAGRLTFYEMQQMVLSERWEAGECLIRFVNDDTDRSRPIPLALELIEADRFAPDSHFSRGVNRDTGNEVRRGVEIDRNGRPVAYHLYATPPNDLNSFNYRPRRFDASEFLHLYRPTRIGQTRGVTEFASIMRWCHGLHRYVDHEQLAKEVASCLSVVIKTMDGNAAGGIAGSSSEDTTDTSGNAFEFIEPGLVARLMPGEDVSVVNPSRGAEDSKAWIGLMLRSMGVGTGLSYERLTRDYSETNYSSNRAGDLEDRREFRMEQQWLIEKLCRPVWRRFIASASNVGVDGFPSVSQVVSRFDEWTAHVWHAPGWEWVDPEKEAKASQLALAGNLTTYADELGAHGKDWRTVLEQRAREVEYMKSLGLSPEVENQQGNGNAEKDTADNASE